MLRAYWEKLGHLQAEINLNPYQGLKHYLQITLNFAGSHAEINLNPYQGLKHKCLGGSGKDD